MPVASVGNLETYGVLTGIELEEQRTKALDVFSRVYSPMIGQGPVLDYFAPDRPGRSGGGRYSQHRARYVFSSVEYGGDTVAQYMRNIAQVHLAGLGTRGAVHHRAPTTALTPTPASWRTTPGFGRKTSHAVADFYDDLKEHNAAQRRR